MTAIEHALLALIAAASGDAKTAQEHVARAQGYARATARRERQIVQIATLVVAGQLARAEGLSREHAAEFPDDSELLAHVSEQPSQHPFESGHTRESR